MYAERPLREYLDDLAARKPAPGGGSAAALEAAIGCALISMVTNFTISNKKYIDVKKKAEMCLKISEALRKKLIRLVDEDVKAYTELSNAFKGLAKDSPELEQAYKNACSVPEEICNTAYEAIGLCKDLVEFGNKNLVTDTAIAALMLESAFFGAKFNVYINLKYIRDTQFIQKAHDRLSKIEDAIPKIKEEILHRAQEIILK
ncbi:MAG: cyclodeaminase/cyclohydrolase family protein [Candidatus Omnitrophica bacterium]|nr:cyclodeaminase/cyclohydrolase family protein [Candidatus Omnitrophota bacterium]